MATTPPPPPPPSPPPPPPPLPPPVSSSSPSSNNEPPHPPRSSSSEAPLEEHQGHAEKLIKSATTLESMRSQLSEHEASVHFASTLLAHPTGLPYSTQDPSNAANKSNATKHELEHELKKIHSFISPSVKDAWFALLVNSSSSNAAADTTTAINTDNNNTLPMSSTIDDVLLPTSVTSAYNSSNFFMVQNDNVHNPDLEYPLSKGQLTKATKIHALSTSLHHASAVASQLAKNNKNEQNGKMQEQNVGQEQDRQKRNRENMNEVQSITEMIQTIQSDQSSTSASLSNSFNSATARTPTWIMNTFQNHIRSIREYHARHDLTSNNNAINNNEAMMNYSLDEMTILNERERYNPTTGITSKPTTSTTTTSSSIQNMIEKQEKRKKRKISNPMADGYDLYSILNQNLQQIPNGDMFSMDEVMGKYLDLSGIHYNYVCMVPVINDLFLFALKNKDKGDASNNKHEKNNDTHDNHHQHQENISYPDFCIILQQNLSTALPESKKLSSAQNTRKKYVRFLLALQSYLQIFLKKVSPLLDVEKEVIGPSMTEFNREWSSVGGVNGWECKLSECTQCQIGVSSSDEDDNNNKGEAPKEEKNSNNTTITTIDLKQYKDVQSLLDNVSADDLKSELSRLGMKCGGTPLDRAKRLWFTRDKPLDELPAKLFVKKGQHVMNKNNNRGGKVEQGIQYDNDPMDITGGNQRRVDIARLEVVVTALLDQLRPTLDATTRRAERRLTQTSNEKEREMEEELIGAFTSANEDGLMTIADDDDEKNDHGDDTDSEDEDTPIYNPKGVPLGWDGKPIPYWLFKLHGLNHFYTCEICGNTSYRGRHNFEKHFAEAKHSYGMKCLGIPNTRHFHGVTKIADAQNLWDKLQQTVNKDTFDGAKEEEYEDSHGNVLTRSRFEDLARQGLL